MTLMDLPPSCPVCGGQTRLKEMHRASRGNNVTCFFRCVDCATEYPHSIDEARISGLVSLVPRPGEGEPA